MSLTSLTSVCPVQSTSLLCMAVSTPSFLVLSKGPTGQFQAQPHLFSNGHRFFNCKCASHQSGTQFQNVSPLASNSNLNTWRETAITSPLNHLKSSPSLSVVSLSTYPLHHVPLVARFVTSVVISNNWARCTSVAPII